MHCFSFNVCPSGQLYNASELYRYIGSSRVLGYLLSDEEKKTRDLYDSLPLGAIPQVASTYVYFDSSYGVMNEKRLMIGECTCGAGAGPWSNPTRYENNPDQGNAFEINVFAPKGAWERPLSIYRCGMMWINQARAGLPEVLSGIAWVGLDRPAANCLLPFYCGVTSLPASVQKMNLLEFDMDCAWWAFNFVANFATVKYSYMMPDLQVVQAKLEAAAYGKIAEFNQSATCPTPEMLTAYCSDNAEAVRKAWWSLANQLIVKYNDGCRTTQTATMQKIDYPEPWLRNAGYYQGPISYNKQECREGRAD